MCRILLLSLMWFASALASGEDNQLKSVEGWGQIVDPEEDSNFTIDGKALAIEFGPGPRTLDAEKGGPMNSPRVVQAFAGGFALQVTVDGNLPLPAPDQVQGRAYISGGLMLWQNEKNYIRLERASFTRGGEIWYYTNFEQRVDGKRTRMGRFADFPIEKDKPVQLRVEVQEEDVRALVRMIGTEWHELGLAKIYDRAEVLAGVSGVKTDAAAATVTFRDLNTQREFVPVVEKSASDIDMDSIRRMLDSPQTSNAAWRDLLSEMLEFQRSAKEIGRLSSQEQEKLIQRGIELGTRKTPKRNAYLAASIARRLANSLIAAKQPKQAVRVYREFAQALEKLRVGSLEPSIAALQDAAKKLEAVSNQ